MARPWSSSVVWSIWGSCPIGTAVASGHLSFDFVDQMFVDHPPLTGKTFREIAEELGLPLETLTRLYAMWGLPRPAPEDVVREDDAPTFSEWKAFFPPQALNEQLLTQGAGCSVRPPAGWPTGAWPSTGTTSRRRCWPRE